MVQFSEKISMNILVRGLKFNWGGGGLGNDLWLTREDAAKGCGFSSICNFLRELCAYVLLCSHIGQTMQLQRGNKN